MMAASVWLAHPKYCHTTLNPSAFSICHTRMAIEARNKGTPMSRRLGMGRWSSVRPSATIRRAERKAVSPLVMGAATTPRIASTAPNVPSQLLQTNVTTSAAEVRKPACASGIMEYPVSGEL